MATPFGPKPSYDTSSIIAPPAPPAPFLIARSMFACGILASRALSIAKRSLKLDEGSSPPSRTVIVIAIASFEKAAPLFLSVAAFLCLICDHFECPDINILKIN